MKIALIGCGGMGKEVWETAEERGHEVTFICDPDSLDATHKKISKDIAEQADIIIDFSHPDAVIQNVEAAAEAGTNIVVGTTGWYERMEAVEKIVKDSDIGFLWSSNFSIGVNLYFKIIEYAAQLFNAQDNYDVWGHEIHHSKKVDSPSGTAKTLAEIIIENIDRKEKLQEETLHRKIKSEELHFSSTRAGDVNFSHTIGFDSNADTIKIEHTARDRSGYAAGAVKAAEWLTEKTGIYTMEDFLKGQK